MRAFTQLGDPIIKEDLTKQQLRQWFTDWAFTEPQRETSIGAPVMTSAQLEQYEWKLLNQNI